MRDLLESTDSCGLYLFNRAANQQGRIVVGIPLQNRHDKNEPFEILQRQHTVNLQMPISDDP